MIEYMRQSNFCRETSVTSATFRAIYYEVYQASSTIKMLGTKVVKLTKQLAGGGEEAEAFVQQSRELSEEAERRGEAEKGANDMVSRLSRELQLLERRLIEEVGSLEASRDAQREATRSEMERVNGMLEVLHIKLAIIEDDKQRLVAEADAMRLRAVALERECEACRGELQGVRDTGKAGRTEHARMRREMRLQEEAHEMYIGVLSAQVRHAESKAMERGEVAAQAEEEVGSLKTSLTRRDAEVDRLKRELDRMTEEHGCGPRKSPTAL